MTAEQRDPLRQSGIDYDEAMERFGGNAALYERLVVKYLDDPHYDGLREALSNGRTEEAHKHAHALKGVAGNLSFTALYQTASAITDALRSGDETEVQLLMPRLDEAHTSVTAVLSHMQKQDSGER